MQQTVYVETTIPSFYYEIREEPEMIARRDWTRKWWTFARQRQDLVTSPAVINELEQGNYPSRAECLELMEPLPLLAIDVDVMDIVQTYIDRQVMPADPAGDAMHLALASYHRCDFLVTWNCRHLANASKFGHIRLVNTALGLFVPTLVTPLELLAEDDDED